MREGLVSVITPMYNSEKTIALTIDSVLAQTYSNWEMIIMDDCSTDGSADIVAGYMKQDSRIRYYAEEKNSGVAKVRTDAIGKAKGLYLAFLDSDDLWRENKLQCQIEFMKKHQVSFCYSACGVVNEFGQAAGKIRNVPAIATYDILLKGNFIPCLTVVIKKELFSGIEIPEIPHEDYVTWLAILRTGIKAYGINEVLADYRLNSRSVSANKWKAAGWTWNIYYHQEKLSFIKSLYYFANYLIRAVRKRL